MSKAEVKSREQKFVTGINMEELIKFLDSQFFDLIINEFAMYLKFCFK